MRRGPVIALCLALSHACALAAAPTLGDDTDAGAAASPAQRPALRSNRWQEDWSALADPRLRSEPLDALKYIPLGADPHRYLSLGLNLRERLESNNTYAFGTSGWRADSYLLQRLQVHADLRLDEQVQLFTQLEDVRAPGKVRTTPSDQNRLDLRQAFVAVVGHAGEGVYKVRVGRQEMGFDVQRFVSVRDGPNVRQAFDAIWADWEYRRWRIIGFVSQPVQYRSEEWFDDYSNGDLSYGGLRFERQQVGPGDLAAYYSRFRQDRAEYPSVSGNERRDNFDVRYFGVTGNADWDIELMGQTGYVGVADVRAWALGSRLGYTFAGAAWKPRAGVQIDAASGDRDAGDRRLQTFNPLFPNGQYFTLAGYTGYVNLIHFKPSLTLRPRRAWTLTGAFGLQWRQTSADAIYIQPSNAVPGSAGEGGRWTGWYQQARAEYAINTHLSSAVELVHFQIGGALRRAGGDNANYANLELKFAW